MTRRILVPLLIAVLVLSEAACAKEKSAGTTGTAQPKMGFVVSAKAAHFSEEMAMGFTVGARQGGADATVEGPPSPDPPKQVQMFEELTRTEKDGVALAPNGPGGPEMFSRPAADAIKAGVSIVAVDGPPPVGSHITLCVANDNYELGQQLAKTLIEKLPPAATGKVVIGSPAPGAPVLDLRAKGIREAFAKERPGIEVTGPFYTEQDEVASRKAWTQLAKANQNVVALVAVGDEGADIAAVRKATGGTWLGAAFDLNPDALTELKSGNLAALVSPEHFLKGAVAGRLMAQHAKSGDPLPQGWIYIPGLTVTAANLAEISARQESDRTRTDSLKARIDEIVKNPRAYLRPLAEAR